MIGAQKSGTTTLSQDLNTHPSIYVPPGKEVNALIQEKVYSQKGLKNYRGFFAKAQPHQLCGDASTRYSMFPNIDGVPERALEVLGRNTKIIYIVRDPVERILSQYKHWFSNQKKSIQENYNIQDAIQDFHHFTDNSRYGMQLNVWLRFFPADNIRVVHFESYIQNRRQVLQDVFSFLEVQNTHGNNISGAANKAESRRTVPPYLKKLTKSRLYKAHIKSFMPYSLRRILKSALTKPAILPDGHFGNEWRSLAKRQLESDQKELARLLDNTEMNWEAGTWNHGAVCRPINTVK